MMFTFSLSIKNLFRHRRRTFITAGAIAVGIAMFIWMDAFLLGLEKDSERNIIWYESGPAKIFHREYWEEREYLPLKHVIDNPDLVESFLREEGIGFTRRLTFGGELFYGEGSLPVKLIGTDPDKDDSIFRIGESIDPGGKYPSAGKPEILLGGWLAEDLGVQVGDFVEIRTRTREGAMQTMELEVVGAINSPNPVINKGTGFLPIDLASEDLLMQGAVTEIVLDLPEDDRSIDAVEGLLETFNSRFPDLTILPWQVMAADFIALAQMKTTSSNIMIFLILIIAAVGITNTMLIAVFERVREIGMMRAMGMKDSSIRWAFIVEAGGIGLIGSLIGLAIGGALTFWFVNGGLDFSAFYGKTDIGYRIYGVFRAAWHPEAMVTAFVLGILISMIIALVPASRALRMKITDCLRYE